MASHDAHSCRQLRRAWKRKEEIGSHGAAWWRSFTRALVYFYLRGPVPWPERLNVNLGRHRSECGREPAYGRCPITLICFV